jgi:hypothetical protein
VAGDVGADTNGTGVVVAVGCVVGALVCGRNQHSTDPAPYGVYLPAGQLKHEDAPALN